MSELLTSETDITHGVFLNVWVTEATAKKLLDLAEHNEYTPEEMCESMIENGDALR